MRNWRGAEGGVGLRLGGTEEAVHLGLPRLRLTPPGQEALCRSKALIIVHNWA